MTSGPDIASVEFWFDPACPFTWRTSRWLVDVAGRRRIDVQWRLMSLSILNEGRDVPEQYREGMRQSRRALRVLAAAQQASGLGAVGCLYTIVGGHKHEQGQVYDDEMLRTGVAEAELPAELAARMRRNGTRPSVRATTKHSNGWGPRPGVRSSRSTAVVRTSGRSWSRRQRGTGQTDCSTRSACCPRCRPSASSRGRERPYELTQRGMGSA